MATALLPTGGIALIGAPDRDVESRGASSTPIQAMQVDLTQDIVDELLESVRSGKAPQILFGRTPVCVHISPEAFSCSHPLFLLLFSCCCSA
jgi:RNA polymerase II elongation factor ELL